MTTMLFLADPYLRHCATRVTHADERGIRLAETVFYATGGGQPGDRGELRLTDGASIAIVDTIKGDAPDEIIHVVDPAAALPPVGAEVVAEIDWQRRHRHMRMHTCLHLLCAVVDAGVTGGSVSADKGRLDFDLEESTLDKTDLTERLNRLIAENRAVTTRWMATAELAAQPELVKTLSVKPPMHAAEVRLVAIDGIDLQPCGGTHVAATGEIGAVQVVKIEKKSRHNRRVVVAFAEDAGAA